MIKLTVCLNAPLRFAITEVTISTVSMIDICVIAKHNIISITAVNALLLELFRIWYMKGANG